MHLDEARVILQNIPPGCQQLIADTWEKTRMTRKLWVAKKLLGL